ncbi:thiamin pyrophosphokinase 1-like isoform X2 [Acropora millepora]|uniref:thiamin pyrophosphokinase 1-like isoform X2 n=1 Tax=Acropora millepora TaxID=45264 RepID=UPI001CF0D937|nr:thiamin pyrophosphokinase 1-like isoform X2 [Acropora millepora]
MTTHWTPLACLLGSTKSECDFQDERAKLGLVVVNMPLTGMTEKFKKLWSIASIKAFADGGANQVHRIVGDNLENYLPDYISGDFDSICPDVMNFYKAKGVQVIPTPDQNETDLTKCLRILLGKQDMVEGKHVIHVNTGLEDDWCGLIPIGAECTHITTSGLKYNLTDGQLAFGSLVSTSNTYVEGGLAVTVENDTPILWAMGIHN